MNNKVLTVILGVASAGLVIAFLIYKSQSDEQRKTAQTQIGQLTQEVKSVRQTNQEIADVNLQLNQALTNNQAQILELSNSLATAASTLADSRVALSNAQDQITGLNTQVAGLNSHITELEQANKVLDEHATELTNTISQLNLQIADTRSKLATSESNNAYLQQALQRQMAEKAEVEHKFNDLDALRTQIKTIKNDLYVARRLQLMKNDTSNKKGAELLISPNKPVPAANSGYGLNVEIGSDGSVKVIPPIGATNSAAH